VPLPLLRAKAVEHSGQNARQQPRAIKTLPDDACRKKRQ